MNDRSAICSTGGNFSASLNMDEDTCICCSAYCENVCVAYKTTIAAESTLQIKGRKFTCSLTVILSLKKQALQVLSDYLHRPEANIATMSAFT